MEDLRWKTKNTEIYCKIDWIWHFFRIMQQILSEMCSGGDMAEDIWCNLFLISSQRFKIWVSTILDITSFGWFSLETCCTWIYLTEHLTKSSLFFGFGKESISSFLLIFSSLREWCSLLFFLIFLFGILAWGTSDPLKYFTKLYVP